MELIRVTVQATDPFTLAGLEVTLRPLTQLTVVRHAPADVAIVAIERLTADAQQLLRTILDTFRAPIVLITNQQDETFNLPALEQRLAAVVSRSAADECVLLRAVLSAANGERSRPAPEQVAADNEGVSATGLSMREVEVLRLMAEGLDTQQIGRELGYSERTIKNIIYGFTTRIRLRNRSHAVSYAMRTGVI